ncbi:hypothetical protein [Proteus vulgaris]|jgi:hypothetical protein|uniref:hypothetical protein n=2 Tax=Morganellaceae TaxID=1903414 RepID=UPI0013D42E3A|nr:hypothetical protein [Proteus vulgaris]
MKDKQSKRVNVLSLNPIKRNRRLLPEQADLVENTNAWEVPLLILMLLILVIDK